MANIPLIQIPGNIKQKYLPFVINPWAMIHDADIGKSPDFASSGASPQLFSYKLDDVEYAVDHDAGSMILQFFPSSMDSISIDDDISYKMLYPMRQPNTITKTNISLSDILNAIPGVSIREYLPDTRLDQCINFFIDMFQGIGDVIKSAGDEASSQKDKKEEAGFFSKLLTAAEYTIKYMTGFVDPNMFNDVILAESMDLPLKAYRKEIFNGVGKTNADKMGYYVLTFPFILYYRLQSCITTNIYKVPAMDSNKRVLHGGGAAGWGDGSDFMSAGGFRISGFLSKLPLIGDLANMILGNIGINYTPWWNAEAGAKTQEPSVELKFDLYNDSAEAAMNNFIFVNTIVPNNRWLQYNMFQHSSSLYDVKIEGLNRLFACRGDIGVTYEGVLREPPISWLKTLSREHLNYTMDANKFLWFAWRNKLIKIPDVYRVTMTFQSLLPANFNNYLYSYSQNRNHISEYGENVYQPTIGKQFGELVGKFTKRLVKVWETNSIEAGSKLFSKEKSSSSESSSGSSSQSSENSQQQQQSTESDEAAAAAEQEQQQAEELERQNQEEMQQLEENEPDMSNVEGSDEFEASNTADEGLQTNESDVSDAGSRTMENESMPEDTNTEDTSQHSDVDNTPTEDDLINEQERSNPQQNGNSQDDNPNDVGPDDSDPGFEGW